MTNKNSPTISGNNGSTVMKSTDVSLNSLKSADTAEQSLSRLLIKSSISLCSSVEYVSSKSKLPNAVASARILYATFMMCVEYLSLIKFWECLI